MWSRYPIEALILEKRGESYIITNDRCGKRFDQNTGHTTYQLQKRRDVIDVLPFKTIMAKKHVNTNFLETLISKLRPTEGVVTLLNYGSKQYKPVNITQNDTGLRVEDEQGNIFAVEAVRDNNGNVVYQEKMKPFDLREQLPEVNFEIIDWDDVNTTLNEMENSYKRRIAARETWAKFLMPLALIGVVAIVCIVMLYLTYSSDIQFCNAPVQVIEQPFEPELKAEDQTLKIVGITNEGTQNP